MLKLYDKEEMGKLDPRACREFFLANYTIQTHVKIEPKLLLLLNRTDRD